MILKIKKIQPIILLKLILSFKNIYPIIRPIITSNDNNVIQIDIFILFKE